MTISSQERFDLEKIERQARQLRADFISEMFGRRRKQR